MSSREVPKGLSEHYQNYDEITSSIPNMIKCVDDKLLWADTIEGSFSQACSWLNICGTLGITLNPDKFIIDILGIQTSNREGIDKGAVRVMGRFQE